MSVWKSCAPIVVVCLHSLTLSYSGWSFLKEWLHAAMCAFLRPWLLMAGFKLIQHKNHLRVVLNAFCCKRERSEDSLGTQEWPPVGRWNSKWPRHPHYSRSTVPQTTIEKLLLPKWTTRWHDRCGRQPKEKGVKRLKRHYLFETASQNSRNNQDKQISWV